MYMLRKKEKTYNLMRVSEREGEYSSETENTGICTYATIPR